MGVFRDIIHSWKSPDFMKTSKETIAKHLDYEKNIPDDIKDFMEEEIKGGGLDTDETLSLLEGGGYLDTAGQKSKITDTKGYTDYWNQLRGDLDMDTSQTQYYDIDTDEWFPDEQGMIDYIDEHPYKRALKARLQSYDISRPFDYFDPVDSPGEVKTDLDLQKRKNENRKREIATNKAYEARAQIAAGWRHFANTNTLNEDIKKLAEINSKNEAQYPTLGSQGQGGLMGAGQSRGFRPPPGWKKFGE
jgi:hypothetical protein